MTDYTLYAPYASTKQQTYIDALVSEGSQSKAAKLVGVGRRTFQKELRKLREKAAIQGFAPDFMLDKPAPPAFEVSTLRVDSKGNYVPAFAKRRTDSELQELMEAMEEAAANYKRAKPVKPPKETISSLLNLHTISDAHLGLLAWAPETGDDWDLDIATEVVLAAFIEAIERSPKAGTCFINQLGDFLHTDSILPVTPAAGHVLDTDTRYYKLVDRAVYVLRRMVDYALTKHDEVILLCAEGNHDTSAPAWLHVMFRNLYENEPRFSVLESASPYYAYEFGNTMLAFHHGHKKYKPSDIVRIFSSDPQFRPMWGRCKYAYGHTGHMHHERVEDGGMLVTQHPTLAGRSAYESRNGYSSQRACISFTYSKEYGERSSIYVKPEMIGKNYE